MPHRCGLRIVTLNKTARFSTVRHNNGIIHNDDTITYQSPNPAKKRRETISDFEKKIRVAPFWTTSPSNSITEETKRFAFAPTIVTYPIVWIVDCGLRITGYGVEEHTRITCGSDTPRSARGISWSYNPHCGGRALFIAGAHAHAHAHGSVLGGVPSTLIDKS
ncbi:hypothetical protein E6O75_ATG03173 [Venturia nashicola]|uniref:Uncharacterized protein n=1 Tax=Venturia nashicola TaxID=86259 RepID=A0A4Z1P414_9PEZI|nr:hypothetical protein E6O75_ATG03173 [Venturia nashicola]